MLGLMPRTRRRHPADLHERGYGLNWPIAVRSLLARKWRKWTLATPVARRESTKRRFLYVRPLDRHDVGPLGVALDYAVWLFAAHAIVVAVKMASISRIASSHGRGTRCPGSRTVCICSPAPNQSLRALRRSRRATRSPMTMTSAVFTVIVAAIGGQASAVRDGRRRRHRKHRCSNYCGVSHFHSPDPTMAGRR